MVEAANSNYSVYAHLTPTTHLDKISETVKFALNGDADESIDTLVNKIKEYLDKQRNDGNKVYEILAISPEFMGTPLPLSMRANSLLEDGSDVYVTVRISIDKKKHVAPISSQPIAPMSREEFRKKREQEKLLTYTTITKYSYFESGKKFIKVLLPDLKDLKTHGCECLSVRFPTNRSFFVEVTNHKGVDYKFGVPRLQCRIIPDACSFQAKSGGLEIKLHKKRLADNWWSLFKQKAIGEKDTDEEDAENDRKDAEAIAKY